MSGKVRVTIPGIAWATFEGSGLIQQEHPGIGRAFRFVNRGRGFSAVADLTYTDAERVHEVLESYGDNLTHYADAESRPEGRAMTEAANRLRHDLGMAAHSPECYSAFYRDGGQSGCLCGLDGPDA